MTKNFEIIERIVIILILACTIIAVGIEFYSMYERLTINLADILLLFIYLEVLSMGRNYLVFNEIRMSYPLLIAMTALSRQIILTKEIQHPSTYVYESVAILIIAIAVVVLRVRHLDILNRNISKKLHD